MLDTANALIGEAKRLYPKELTARRGGGARPRLVTVADDRAQADYIVGEVLAAREAGVALRRQAVLFRSGSHSALLDLELTRRRIPFVKYGGLTFLEAAHIKDMLACLRWVDNPRHRLAAFRVLQLLPGMGPGYSERCLTAYAGAGYALGACATGTYPYSNASTKPPRFVPATWSNWCSWRPSFPIASAS